MIGAAMARDLGQDPSLEVVVADVNDAALQALAGSTSPPRLTTRQADVSQANVLKNVIADADVIVGALPSRFGFQTLRAVIEAGKNFVDISFMPEDALELDGLARTRGVTAVVDCGVAPGLANLMIGGSCARLPHLRRVAFYVGGLPKVRRWPFQYKAPFAPSDVIEEYTRPVRLIEDGNLVVKPALSDPELIDFPEVGTLEAFNTDGLRSLVRTIAAPRMVEKTLRYPGHIELMRVLRETGFFGKETMQVGPALVRPLDVTSRLLFPAWKLEPGEAEFTILRVIVEGSAIADASPVRHTYDLYDETDPATGTSSMARTTGYPCTIVARLLASGALSMPGVQPPERVAKVAGVYAHVVAELARRGVRIRFSEAAIEDAPRPAAAPKR
ncbi:MAG: Lysine 6-dehydrogenase [Phycisphaerae bacterium]|nr:Lysine 6-dehydrogenase [Phycisphaerae bacterium]